MASAARLWGTVDGEPFLENAPALAIWGNRPRRQRKGFIMARRRRTSARKARRPRRRARVVVLNRPHRRRRATRRRASFRRNMPMAYNRPKRRRSSRRKGGFGFGRGAGILPMNLLPAVGLGVGAAVGLGYTMPYVARWFNLAPAGVMYRGAQALTVILGGWALKSFKVLSAQNANAIMTGGLMVTGLGLVADWQRGILMPQAQAAMPPPPGGEGLSYYKPALRAPAYGTGRGQMSYYATVRNG